MKKKILFKIAWLFFSGILLAAPVLADATRYQYDYNFPKGPFSMENFRATLRALHQMDVMPLRPVVNFELDAMEYGNNAAAAAQYSGTGVTITREGTILEEGSASLKAVIDGTADRSLERAFPVNMDAFADILVWERSSTASDTFQFYLKDGSGNRSQWHITSSGSAGTWQQHTFDLADPDSTSGTAADLSDIAAYGFRNLTQSTTYYFDTIKAETGMAVAVMGSDLGGYYQHVHFAGAPVVVDAQLSPEIDPPSTNPRIDILVIDDDGVLSWIEGTEASTPSEPWASVPAAKMPVAKVYCKTTMTKVVDYSEKDVETDEAYLLGDVRPFLQKPASSFTGLTDTPSSITASQYLKGNAGGTALEFGTISQTFLGLTDTPASYSGQGGKLVGVNSGATAVEFKTNDLGKVLLNSGDATAGYLDDKITSYGFLPTVQQFSTSGTWTKPSGVKEIFVQVVGGGGGGGSATSSNYSAASGGGGGGYGQKTIDVTSITTVTVTIGAGGTAGNAGGTTSFGTHCSATGGAAGAEKASGGAGGIGTGCDLNVRGGGGGAPGPTGGGTLSGGSGGNSFFGSGAAGVFGDNAGVNGNSGGAYGGGGGGAVRDSSSRTGGTGGGGFVIVYY